MERLIGDPLAWLAIASLTAVGFALYLGIGRAIDDLVAYWRAYRGKP